MSYHILVFCLLISWIPGDAASGSAPSHREAPRAFLSDEHDAPTPNRKSLNEVGTLWYPYIEWSVENGSHSGNPFDVEATVTFTHTESGAEHATQMFYDGGDTWKWRFTGTLVGDWTFASSSGDSDLDGLSGTVTIEPNPDESAYGFTTHYESETHTKWARYTGNEGDIETFIPQFVMYYDNFPLFFDNPDQIAGDIDVFFDEHGFNGFHLQAIGKWWFDMDAPNQDLDGSEKNPDIRTFEALELLITMVHEAGGVVHIWPWGDQSRDWSSTRLSGGANGDVDRRLQRYIAARLGPLPGWSMGYGFDLFEWADENMLKEWQDYMQAHMGWMHYLGGRSNKNRLNQIYEGLDYSSYEWHRPGYNDYIDHIQKRPGKPAFSEDRFRIRNAGRDKDYSMEDTRKGLWHSAMAGGVANIWGNLVDSDSRESQPYPKPEQIKTYSTFWEGRLLRDMEPCNDLSNGYCLADPEAKAFIFYKEDTDRIDVNLEGVGGVLPAVLVDTKKKYDALTSCQDAQGTYTIKAPYKSDWALAIGDFGDGSKVDCKTLPVELNHFDAASDGDDVLLTWSTASELNNAGFEVQLKSDQDPAFRTVLFVEGHGTVDFEQTYAARLPGLSPGTYVFRLRQIDFNGDATYSDEVEHEHDVTQKYVLREAFPSPFKTLTTLGVAVAEPQHVTVMLYDALGRRIQTLLDRQVAPHTMHDIQVQANNLPSGIYFVHIKGAFFETSKRILLRR